MLSRLAKVFVVLGSGLLLLSLHSHLSNSHRGGFSIRDANDRAVRNYMNRKHVEEGNGDHHSRENPARFEYKSIELDSAKSRKSGEQSRVDLQERPWQWRATEPKPLPLREPDSANEMRLSKVSGESLRAPSRAKEHFQEKDDNGSKVTSSEQDNTSTIPSPSDQPSLSSRTSAEAQSKRDLPEDIPHGEGQSKKKSQNNKQNEYGQSEKESQETARREDGKPDDIKPISAHSKDNGKSAKRKTILRDNMTVGNSSENLSKMGNQNETATMKNWSGDGMSRNKMAEGLVRGNEQSENANHNASFRGDNNSTSTLKKLSSAEKEQAKTVELKARLDNDENSNNGEAKTQNRTTSDLKISLKNSTFDGNKQSEKVLKKIKLNADGMPDDAPLKKAKLIESTRKNANNYGDSQEKKSRRSSLENSGRPENANERGQQKNTSLDSSISTEKNISKELKKMSSTASFLESEDNESKVENILRTVKKAEGNQVKDGRMTFSLTETLAKDSRVSREMQKDSRRNSEILPEVEVESRNKRLRNNKKDEKEDMSEIRKLPPSLLGWDGALNAKKYIMEKDGNKIESS